jgi:hypothetical protein
MGSQTTPASALCVAHITVLLKYAGGGTRRLARRNQNAKDASVAAWKTQQDDAFFLSGEIAAAGRSLLGARTSG